MPQDHPIPKIGRRIVRGENAMIAEVRLEQGFKVVTHDHPNEQFACVLSGKMLFGVGRQGEPDYYEIVVHPGEVLVLPGNIPHSAEALEESVLFDVFSPPSAGMGVDAVARQDAHLIAD
jgi:quercetin dioxygenase-like cupin family protein